jgi:hypothetical protein
MSRAITTRRSRRSGASRRDRVGRDERTLVGRDLELADRANGVRRDLAKLDVHPEEATREDDQRVSAGIRVFELPDVAEARTRPCDSWIVCTDRRDLRLLVRGSRRVVRGLLRCGIIG